MIISVNKDNESSKHKYDAVVSVGLECFTKALFSLHGFTGCDTVSALAGLGKSKAFKRVRKNIDYIKIFEILGKVCHIEKQIVRYIFKGLCVICTFIV